MPVYSRYSVEKSDACLSFRGLNLTPFPIGSTVHHCMQSVIFFYAETHHIALVSVSRQNFGHLQRPMLSCRDSGPMPIFLGQLWA